MVVAADPEVDSQRGAEGRWRRWWGDRRCMASAREEEPLPGVGGARGDRDCRLVVVAVGPEVGSRRVRVDRHLVRQERERGDRRQEHQGRVDSLGSRVDTSLVCWCGWIK